MFSPTKPKILRTRNIINLYQTKSQKEMKEKADPEKPMIERLNLLKKRGKGL